MVISPLNDLYDIEAISVHGSFYVHILLSLTIVLLSDCILHLLLLATSPLSSVLFCFPLDL